MVYVDPFPTTLPSSTDPANFDTRADAFYGHLPTFVDQLNALPPILAAAAGTAVMAFKFKTATSGDPGSGGVLLNNSTQASATGANIDLLDALGNDVSGRLARLGAGTSTVKGELVLTKVGDGRVWLSFEVTSGTSPGGYRALVLQNGLGSSSNPFSANDDIAVAYVAAGDKGATGPVAGWSNVLSGSTLDGLSQFTLSSLPSGYSDLAVRFDYASGGTPNTTIAVSADGSTFGSAVNLFGSGTASGTVWILLQDYKSDRPNAQAIITATPSGSPSGAVIQQAGGATLNCTGGVSALRIALPLGAWNTGTLYQPRAR